MEFISFPLGNKEIVFQAGLIKNSGSFLTGIIDDDSNISPQQNQPGNTAQAANLPAQGEEPEGGGFASFLPIIVIYGGLLFAMYFFMFRPQRKREKKMVEMQDSLRVGDNIVTNSGLFGKIVELGQDAHVVEFGTNRGIKVPVRKSDIAGIKTPVLTPPHNKDLPALEKNDKDTGK